MAGTTLKKACHFDIDGLHLSALRWGEGNPHKVIALHGWLDNAASFSLLIPYLRNTDVVVPDLAGHGKSGFRPGASAYNIWQDLKEIAAIADALGWKSFSIIGHSRGAMIGCLYAGTFPEQINALCLIDAITPKTIAEADLPKQLADSIKALRQINDQRSSYFASYEQAVLARTRGAYPLSKEAATLLAERAVEQDSDKGFYWRYDKRLLVASEVRFSDAQVKAFVDAFPCQAKVILAKDGFVHENDVSWFAAHPKLDIVEVAGDHHLQLSADHETLSLLAKIINDYFNEI